MLEYLARNAGRVVGRAELCEHVWDENHDPMLERDRGVRESAAPARSMRRPKRR